MNSTRLRRHAKRSLVETLERLKKMCFLQRATMFEMMEVREVSNSAEQLRLARRIGCVEINRC